MVTGAEAKAAATEFATTPNPTLASFSLNFLAEAEAEAKKRWLSRLDAPTWGRAASVVGAAAAEAAQMAKLTEKCEEGDDEACDTLSKEEEAKKRWLARLDAPTWGKAAAALASVAAQAAQVMVPGQMSEEEAKARWLARLDAPAWGPAASVATAAPAMSEEEAKARWLARLDAPTWGPAAGAATAAHVDFMAPAMSEEEAKARWLARLDA